MIDNVAEANPPIDLKLKLRTSIFAELLVKADASLNVKYELGTGESLCAPSKSNLGISAFKRKYRLHVTRVNTFN